MSGPLSVGFNEIANNSSTPSTTLTGVPATPTFTGAAQASPFHFARNLQYQDRDPDVQRLQEFLNTHGALVSDSGGGSLGNETTYFAHLTYQALIRFQNAHAADILAPLGLTAGTGFFGPATRDYINSL